MAKLRVAALALASISLLGCDTFSIQRNTPGTTYGVIDVGAPRVNSRERLINDRLEQEEWLKGWLDRSASATFDINAKSDVRSLAQTSAQVGIQADPMTAAGWLQGRRSLDAVGRATALDESLFEIQKSSADAILDKVRKKEIQPADAKAELEKLGLALPTQSTPTSVTATAGNQPGSFAPLLPASSALRAASLTQSAPTAATATLSDLRGSPTDLFRDQLALREEIRTEINDNALDDAHDVSNNTLLRLTLDATVLPGRDTSAWAYVLATLRPGRQREVTDLAVALALEQQARSQLKFYRQLILSQAADASETCAKKVSPQERVACVINDVLPDSILRDALLQKVASAEPRRLPKSRLGLLAFSTLADDHGGGSNDLLADITSNLQEAYQRQFDVEYGCLFELRVASPSSRGLQQTGFSAGGNADFTLTVRPRSWTQMVDAIQPPRAAQGGVATSASPGPDLNAARSAALSGTYSYVLQPGATGGPAGNLDHGSKLAELDLIKTRINTCGWENASQADAKVKEILADSVQGSRMAVYGVMPKETVQRISEVSSRRTAMEFALGLSVAARAANVGALIDTVRANDAFNEAIKRQPLVVGFTRSGASTRTDRGMEPLEFGWLLGPQFRVSEDGKSAYYRHSPRQQALSAVLSVPKLWPSVQLEVQTYWVGESGIVQHDKKRSFAVELPNKPSAIIDALRASSVSYRYADRRPQVLRLINTTVTEDKGATLLIEGHDLWRGTEVFLGSQRASSIRVLPDMRGVVATFAPVGSLEGSSKMDSRYPVTVHTSEGMVTAGMVRVVKAPSAANVPALKLARTSVIGTDTFLVQANQAVGGYARLDLMARSRSEVQKSVVTTEAGRSVSGTELSFRLPASAAQTFPAGETLDLFIRLAARPGDFDQVLPIGSAIFYPATTDASAKLKVPANPTLPTAIEITFPPNSEQAFPLVRSGPLFTGSTISQSDQPVALKVGDCKIDKRKCTVTVDVANAAERKTVKAGADVVIFGPVDEPPFSGLTFKLKAAQ